MYDRKRTVSDGPADRSRAIALTVAVAARRNNSCSVWRGGGGVEGQRTLRSAILYIHYFTFHAATDFSLRRVVACRQLVVPLSADFVGFSYLLPIS